MKLFELKGPDSLASGKIKRFARILKRDCMPFLQQIDFKIAEYPMYRGINPKQRGSTIIPNKRTARQKTVRLKDRISRDTLQKIHNAINKHFIKMFGEPFRNALFATGRLSSALTYGDAYFVFPIGQFKFLWSPHIFDLWNEDMVTVDDYLNTIDGGDYQTTDLKSAIKSENEIMIRVPKYHMIQYKGHIYSISDQPAGITKEELQQIQQELLK